MKVQDVIEIREIYSSSKTASFFVIYEKALEREINMSSGYAIEGKGEIKEVIKVLKGNTNRGSMETLAEYRIGEL